MSVLTRPIALVGMMGSGKTTLAKVLADWLGIVAADSDVMAEQLMGKTIPECFAEDGEAVFRQWEEKALKKLCLSISRMIIATGGGIVTYPSGWAFLKEHAVTVWLDVPGEELWERLRKNPGSRPLLSDKKGFLALAAARQPKYAEAEHRMPLAGLSKDEAVTKLIGWLEKQRQS